MSNERVTPDALYTFLLALETAIAAGREWSTFPGHGLGEVADLAIKAGWAVVPEAHHPDRFRGERCFKITDLGLSFVYLSRAQTFMHAAESIYVEHVSDPVVRARLEEVRNDLRDLSVQWSTAVTAKKPERIYR